MAIEFFTGFNVVFNSDFNILEKEYCLFGNP